MRRQRVLPLTETRAGLQCGVEREYQVVGSGQQLDFRDLIGQLTKGLVARDPGDPRARRLPNGVGLTADGWEAELVTPPTEVSPHGLASIAASLERAEGELGEQLSGASLHGFSTHLNVSVPDRRAVEVAMTFAASCTAVLDALARPAECTGYLVRPRRWRLEVGTDFLDPGRLLMALAIVAGCAAALVDGDRPPQCSPSRLSPSRERFGYFVPPDAVGAIAESTLVWADHHVRALGLPGLEGDPLRRYADLAAEGRANSDELDVAPRTRGDLRIECAYLTWRLVAWRISEGSTSRSVYAVIPEDAERQFLALVDQGLLDRTFRQQLDQRRVRVLYTHAQTTRPAFWHDIRPGALVPAERGPGGAVPMVGRRAARRAYARQRRPDARVDSPPREIAPAAHQDQSAPAPRST